MLRKTGKIMNPLRIRFRCPAYCRILVAALSIAGSLFAANAPAGVAPDARKKLVMLIAEPEYDTAKTLPPFARQALEKDFRVVVVSAPIEQGQTRFDHMAELETADVLLVSVRRCTPPREQLDAIRRYVRSGRPVVGIRTASHAFVLRREKPAEGNADWPEWDAEVFGGNYTNHHGAGPVSTIVAVQPKHRMLEGVALPFASSSSLYKVSPLRPGTNVLLTASIPNQPPEPVAWTFRHVGGGRAFYTSLGSPADFQNASFVRLLRNAIAWAASGAE
jgi:type 1 glutamine amidotransferase